MAFKKVVAVSGGFDPLHIGHISLLREARALGDKLIVILNNDDFLIQKKGYIFLPFNQRVELLKALKWVDEVVGAIDSDDTVCKTLQYIKPTIFANGGDRQADNTPESELCADEQIETVYNVGGGKVESSSHLTEALYGKMLNIKSKKQNTD